MRHSKAIFIALILLATILQLPLALIPHVKADESDTWQVEHNSDDYIAMLDTIKTFIDYYSSAVPICSNTGKMMVGLGPWNETMEDT